MKDRMLGMSLSYNRVGDSLVDPLVREELFFQGDDALASYADEADMPFHIISTTGFEPTRSITENAPPARVQNRELTVYLRVRDRSMDIHSILGKYMNAVETNAYSLNAPNGPFYVPTTAGGAGMITLNLLMGDGTPYNVKRFQAKVSIKSLTGDMYAPSNNLYVLVLGMHDPAFIRYDEPFQVTWDLPYQGAFVDASGNNITRGALPITKLPDGITHNRLTRPRITIEATAVPATVRKTQLVEVLGYYRNPLTTGDSYAESHNLYAQYMDINQVINPADDLINPGEKVSVVLNDPLNPGDIYRSPRRPAGTNAGYYFSNGQYTMTHSVRGFEYMNFPIADAATVKIRTGTTDTGTSGKSAADIKVIMDFFDTMTGVVL